MKKNIGLVLVKYVDYSYYILMSLGMMVWGVIEIIIGNPQLASFRIIIGVFRTIIFTVKLYDGNLDLHITNLISYNEQP